MMRLVIAAAMVALSGAAVAQEVIASGDREFVVTCDENGYLLTPRDKSLPTVYLRDDCVVTHPELGNGVWNWANGGVLVQIGPHRLGFWHQYPYCEAWDPDTAACRF